MNEESLEQPHAHPHVETFATASGLMPDEARDHRLWLASLETQKGRGEAVLTELNKHDFREAE